MTQNDGQLLASHEGEVISLADLLNALRKHIIGVMAIFAVCVGVAIAYALAATPLYRAEVTIRPIQDRQQGAASALMGQLGGIASLAGINLPGGGGDDLLPVLRSRLLAQEFIRLHNLDRVILDTSDPSPSMWKAVDAFKKNILTITEDRRSGTVGVSVTWTDPKVAAEWANAFVTLADKQIRARDKLDAERSLKYLQDQVTKTKVLEMQRALYSLIENETRTLMLADARENYALTILDPAFVPEYRVSPKRTMIAVLGAIVGALLGLLYALAWSAVARHHSVKSRSHNA